MTDDTRSFEDVRDEVAGDGYGFIRPSAKADPIESVTDTKAVAKEAYEAVYAARDEPTPKHTTGTINGHSFTLRVDGDAPDELVAEIEATLADMKAEVES